MVFVKTEIKRDELNLTGRNSCRKLKKRNFILLVLPGIILLVIFIVNSQLKKESIHPVPLLHTGMNESDARLVIHDSLYVLARYNLPSGRFKKFINATSNGKASYALQRLWLSIKDQSIKIWKKFRNGKNHKLLFKTNEYYFKLDSSQASGTSLIYNDRNTIIGNLFWANVQDVHIGTILSHDSMYYYINQLLQEEQVLALFSASFYQENGVPEGFFSHRKKVLNPGFNPHWDALVMMDDLTLRVANLISREIITTPAPPMESHTSRNLSDFYFFPEEFEGTVFQLPLLIFNNQMLFDIETAAYRLREFRLLCKVSAPGNNDHYWVLLNHDRPDYLPNAVYGFAKSFNQQQLLISFAVLLDVGANNYLQIFGNNNRADNSFRGIIPPEHAQHILFLKKN